MLRQGGIIVQASRRDQSQFSQVHRGLQHTDLIIPVVRKTFAQLVQAFQWLFQRQRWPVPNVACPVRPYPNDHGCLPMPVLWHAGK